MGTDSHAFAALESKKKLMMGGIEILDENGLEGDSDGDIFLHSAFNAIMSAMGERGLGFYFNKGNMDQFGDSTKILGVAIQKMLEKKFSVVNISFTVEGKRPRLEKHIPAIQQSVGKLLGISPASVGITVTSGDGLTSFGKGEGVYCQAIALLQKS